MTIPAYLEQQLRQALRAWKDADAKVKAAEAVRSEKSSEVERLRAISREKTLEIDGLRIARLGGASAPSSPIGKEIREALYRAGVSVLQVEDAVAQTKKISKEYTRITPIQEDK